MIGYILHDLRNEVAENREEALNLIKASISKFKSPLPQYVTGHIYYESNQRNPALKHFESLVQQYPDFPEGHNDIAVILAENKDYAKSTERVMTAIRLNPSLAEAQKNLVKLVTAEQKSTENFWEFWGSSTARKVTALALLAVAAAPLLASFVIIPVFDSSETDEQNQDVTEDTTATKILTDKDGNITSEVTTTIKWSPSSITEIPNTYLVWLGIIIAVLLIPH